MDLEKIEGLVKIIENSSLTEFTLKEGDMKITMSKLDHPPVVAAGVPAAAAAGAPGPAVEEADQEDEKLFITSPIVGTFLFSSGAGCPDFCKGGRPGKKRTDSMYSGSNEADE